MDVYPLSSLIVEKGVAGELGDPPEVVLPHFERHLRTSPRMEVDHPYRAAAR